MKAVKALLLENIHPVAQTYLENQGVHVERLDKSLDEAALLARLEGFHLLGIRSKTHLSEAFFEKAQGLLAVGAFCIGTNQIALEAASRRGIAVFNAPFSNTRSVAEMVMAEIIMLARRLGERVIQMNKGQWRKVSTGAHEVRGKTIAIVGYGHIGSQVGVLAEAFGMRVIFYDIATKLPMGNNQAKSSLLDALTEAHYVSLHVPETPLTKGMMGHTQLRAMRQGAYLINASRGSVVDIESLSQALKEGHLAGAAIDVFPEEPAANTSDGFVSPLQNLPNVILTPHIGGSTDEAQVNIGTEVAVALSKYLQFGCTATSVNFPQVDLAFTPGAHRVLNVHKNVPGVLRDVNRIVSEQQANILAQVLATHAEMGYLLMDLDKPVNGNVCDAMKQLPDTLVARALY
ncbi:MAG: phosphoglycerate dehydrogenase [Proteobacteria bacterium]|nr:phosphoglycerate dehydrogenase [Cystobacterineae bacterium]MCL2313659.1 phosphoglycerate dehydrogenase [Pseudomonadota bacterium]